LDNIIADQESGGGLLKRIHTFLGRFIRFPSEEAHLAVALWVLHAHVVEKCESTPRLALLSAEPASGKTRALEILELLVPRPILPVNASPAYLFTCVGDEAGLPTILFDEIDTVFGAKAKESNEDVRSFLNAGHRKGAVFGRAVYLGNGNRRKEELPAYCAVALAGLGWLPDTILTRSIVVRMRPRHDGEQIESYRRRKVTPQGDAIRRQLEQWAATVETVDEAEMPAEIQDRNADVWEPLIAIADLIGGGWPERAREAARVLVAEAQDREVSLGVRLLKDIRTLFEGEHMPSKGILARLHPLEESPWGDLKGKPLDDRGLAYRLRQYGIKSKTDRIGEGTARGYAIADFYDAWRRYLPTTQATRPQQVTQNPKAEKKLNGNNGVSHVAHVADFQSDVCVAAGVADRVAGVAADDLSIPPCLDRRHELSGHSRAMEPCAQCNADDGQQTQINGIWLHQECKRFWDKEHRQ
jgi:hypothetical protein